MADSALTVAGLHKSYRTGFLGRDRRVALSDVSFEVPRGGVLGYLGPNGSGKTTTIKVLMGLLRADSGSIQILGRTHSDPAWRLAVGFLPENPYFYDYLTAAEALDYAARLFGIPQPDRRRRSEEILALVGLEQAGGQPLRQFSKGMVQRFGLAQALVNDPDLLLLDEPMSGLDPLGRRLVRDLILRQRDRGKTVFLSTHVLPDAESLCDQVAVLSRGRILNLGRLDQILAIDVSHMEVHVGGVAPNVLDAIAGVEARYPLGERWRVEVKEEALGRVVRSLEEAGARILSVQPVRQSLEDYFLERVGGSEGGRPA